MDFYDDKTKLTIASINTTLAGEDGYNILAIAPLKSQFTTDADALTTYIAQTGIITENTEIRVNQTEKQASKMKIILMSALTLAGLIILFLIISRLALLFK